MGDQALGRGCGLSKSFSPFVPQILPWKYKSSYHDLRHHRGQALNQGLYESVLLHPYLDQGCSKLLAAAGSWLEMQIFWLHSRPAESPTLEVGPSSLCLTSSPDGACWELRQESHRSTSSSSSSPQALLVHSSSEASFNKPTPSPAGHRELPLLLRGSSVTSCALLWSGISGFLPHTCEVPAGRCPAPPPVHPQLHRYSGL